LESTTGPAPGDLALADGLAGELVRLVRLMDRAHAHWHVQHPDAVERSAYLLLVHLVKDGPQRSSVLAESVHSDPSTVSRQVAQLVKLGLVERRPDPQDGRACLLAATAEGVRVFERNRAQRIELLAEMLGDWSTEEQETLRELLARFNTDFENYKLRLGGASPEVAAAQRGM
jgi:DNA-binding MarR family transcriptional regulator